MRTAGARWGSCMGSGRAVSIGTPRAHAVVPEDRGVPSPGLHRRGEAGAAAPNGNTMAAAADAGPGQIGGSAGVRPGLPARLLLAMTASHDIRSWLFPLSVIIMTGVGAGIFAAGLPAGAAGAWTVGLLVIAAALSVVALSGRIRDLRIVVPALIGVGLCGAGLDGLADGPGFVAGYV